MRKWCSRGGAGVKSSGEGSMTLLALILGFLLLIALIYIVVERLTSWLTKIGGFTIRIELDEGKD